MRLGTYTDTLELENEILRDKIKKLQEQLDSYLEAERKVKSLMDDSYKLDQGIVNMMNTFRRNQSY
ncbi:MAG: hypothetical protein RL621_2150 [Bacteroidota bacterium]|jgi:hypothetical protein